MPAGNRLGWHPSATILSRLASGGGRLGPAAAAGALLAALAGAAWAADWPCYRGPNKDGATSERIVSWPPRELWRASVGQGFSGVAVSGGRVYTMGWAGNQDSVYCFSETASGNNPTPVWKQSYACGSVDYEGTRGTPTVDGNEVYTFSHQGRLSCFNKADGTPLWNQSVTAKVPDWGFGSSVLVEGDAVVVGAGRYGTAFRKSGTHAAIWGNDNNTPGYATPFIALVNGQRTMITFSNRAAGIDPATGAVRWYFVWQQGMADPIVCSNKLFVSCGYSKGCAVVNIDKSDGTALATGGAGEWSATVLGNKENCSVLYGGHVYGVNESGLGGGLRCVEFATGTRKWTSVDSGKAFGTESALIRAGDELVVINGSDSDAAGDGDLVVVSATPTGYAEQHRANDIVTGNTWTAPTLANGRLYLRSREGTLVCYWVGPDPEMGVSRGGTAIASGATNAIATALTAGVAERVAFSIRNTGLTNLVLTLPVAAAGTPVNCSAAVVTQPSALVATGGTATVEVDITPAAPGAWSATLSVANNDGDRTPYKWTVRGTAVGRPQMAIKRGAATLADGASDNVTGLKADQVTRLNYLVANTGTGDLLLTVPVAPPAACTNCTAVIATQPASTLSAGARALPLNVDVKPILLGPWSFSLAVANNDPVANPYNWTAGGMAGGDADGDGMLDTWEIAEFGSTNALQGGPSGDFDLDGFSNEEEYRAGTCATNPASCLVIHKVELNKEAGVVLSWSSVANRRYAIYRGTNAADVGTLVASNLPASPLVNRYTNSVSSPRSFYRVLLEP